MGSIVSKAMFPAPEPSYNENTLKRRPFYKVNRVPCLWFPGKSRMRGIILYLHGNGADLGHIQGHLQSIAIKTRHAVIAPKYPGYGTFRGNANPTSCVESAQRVLTYLCWKFPTTRIIVMGSSIGTGVAAQLVHDNPKATQLQGLVLISGFTSIRDVAQPMIGSCASFCVQEDCFNTKDVLKNVTINTLLLHGDCDKLSDLKHPQALFDASAAQCKKLKVLKGNGHNNLNWINIGKEFNTFFAA